MKRPLPLILLVFLIGTQAWAFQTSSSSMVQGVVKSSTENEALPGVNVVLKGTSKGVVTDNQGRFTIPLTSGNHTLVFSFIGYLSKEIPIVVPLTEPLEINLDEDEISLSAFEIVSTGFQELSAERSAGSFVQLDNELINRSVSTNILDRLQDVTPGLIFNRDLASRDPARNISIRGKSTFLLNVQPLIVVDNLAYDGPIENINPNDVESITVLRDATAASIWGARAGNGVIVIKTKRGSFKSPLRVSLNSNLTVGEAFDPYYEPTMAVADLVGIEERLFQEGYYNNRFDSFDKLALSPWVEDLFSNKAGTLNADELARRKEYFQSQDVRRDLQRAFYSPSINQQYALNLNGGSEGYSYFFSAGYDYNQASTVGNSRSRITLNGQQNWKLLKDKVQLSLGTYLIQNQQETGAPNLSSQFAYDRLIGEEGQPLAIFQNYNNRFKQRSMSQGALDWEYRPLAEIGLNPEQNTESEVRINLGLDYEIVSGLNLKVNYQYWNLNTNTEQVYSEDSYFARNLTNLYTEFPTAGTVLRNLPQGGIYNYGTGQSYSHNLRAQLSYNKEWDEIHQLNALAGFEVKDLQRDTRFSRAYGFDPETGISVPVNYQVLYRQLHTGFSSYLPFVDNFDGGIDRFLSYFANAGYTLKGKYLVNSSVRIDASNLFGVDTNLKRVPLWSAGIGWIVSEESWLKKDWLDFLKLKASYGFNGNTNPAATAFTTGILFGAGSNFWVNRPYLSIVNPPNAQARWEKIKILNTGIEFELFKSRLRGSAEIYRKEGIDLFGVQPYFPSSGNSRVTRNYANTRTHGADIQLGVSILEGAFTWNANFFLSLINEKVTRYEQVPLVRNVVGFSGGGGISIPSPIEGRPLQYIFSYPFAGLDPSTGEPLGILEGAPSKEYSKIINQTGIEDLIFHGSAVPTKFGAFRNQFGWKNFELSMNLSYRLGYYFKRETINYTSLNRGNFEHADYQDRWQKPGDEGNTFIGSDPLIVNQTRTSFEMNHSGHVRKGDHIRLQDVQLAYSLQRNRLPNLPFEQIRFYAYLNNLGILWKSAKDVRDPDFRNFQAPRTYSVGLTANF